MISPPFTATHIAKPHEPMLKPKLVKECVCPNTQTENNAAKMKELTRKINNETPTRGIANKGFSGMRRVVARFNFSCTLIGNRPQSLSGHTAKPLQASRKKDNDTMTIKFLLHKDKEEKGKPSPQKQECGCPSLQPSLLSHTHAFLADTHVNIKP